MCFLLCLNDKILYITCLLTYCSLNLMLKDLIKIKINKKKYIDFTTTTIYKSLLDRE